MAFSFPVRLVCLFYPLISAEVLAGTDPIILTPLTSKTGPEKVFVLINGAFVPNTDYVEVAKAIQTSSSQRLWVAIPSFLLNTPNPGQIGSKIKAAIGAIESAGFPGGAGAVKAAFDVVVGGHSLGGIFSQGAVIKGDYAALVLFGSYLSSINGYAVNRYSKPVLTLAGELDGLTRITRIAQSWTEMEAYVASESPTAKYYRPVIALAGVTHSQFCSNVNVTSFGLKDHCPEVSLPDAHAAIGSTVASFLTVVFGGNVVAAKTSLDKGLAYTGALVAGYISAQAMETADWCAAAQSREAAQLKTKIEVAVTKTADFATFWPLNPKIEGKTVTVIAEPSYSYNPTDLSTIDFAANNINCKIKTAAALADHFGEPKPSESSSTCESQNRDAIEKAMSLVSAKTRERYAAIGQPFATEDDVIYSTGFTWQAASLNFDKSGPKVKISSPRVTTSLDAALWSGNQLCKYLSPARVIEYMMVDGMPSFDQCPRAETVVV